MRACNEISGSVGSVLASEVGISSTGETTISYLATSFEMAIKSFYSLHLCLIKYISSQLDKRPLIWNSSISSQVNLWTLRGVAKGAGLVGRGRGRKEGFLF
jgi:hypothetical protein